MNTFTLGGIHPPEHKELACNSAIEAAKPPQTAYIPLSQHIGMPSREMVEVGQRVLAGQQIGNPAGFVSAPVHATISGKVTAIELFTNPMGKRIPAIVIESDKADEWVSFEEDPNYMERPSDVLKERVKNAGIVGMGGATFPTIVKLSPPKEKHVDAVIINGAECEPYLTADHRLMLEHPQEVVEGLKILMRVLELDRGYIGIEENKPDAIAKIKEAAANDKNIEVWTLATKYPQGAEKMLIKTILNREVPPGRLPMDVGVVVQNSGTAYAIYEACRHGRPLLERIVSVTGSGVVTPKNLKVRIGTPISQLLETCGGLKSGVIKVISGGPMMGFAIYDLNTPVTKGTSGIVAMEEQDIIHRTKFNNCIRCGRCVEACPMGLMPLMFSIYTEKRMYEEAIEYHLCDCFECGSCTYVCPSKRPIVQQIRLAKTMVNP